MKTLKNKPLPYAPKVDDLKEENMKKRPGRPKKVNINIPVEIRGIVDKPSSDDNVLEVVYQNPKLFKKIF